VITGRVSSAQEAIIPLQVLGPGHQQINIDAVIDTGFNDYLTLLPLQVAALSLPQQAVLRATLGDGSIATLPVYSATILWDGQMRSIEVLATNSGPLIGTALLYGHRVTIDMVDGGKVTIETLP